MGKITKKKEKKIGGITARRVRQIVQERLAEDRKFLQSPINSSVPIESNDVRQFNAILVCPNVDAPNFSDNEPSLHADNSNSAINAPSLFPCVEDELHIEHGEANSTNIFILNYDSSDNCSSDSDSEITCNEDLRKLNSDVDSDLGEDNSSEFSHSEQNYVKENKFATNLREWSIKFHITLIALSALLLLLRVFDNTLPMDARTLLGTLRKTEIVEMNNGSYHHFGLKRAIENILIERKHKGLLDQNIKLILNVDGLPISNSGTNALWLLLCSDIDLETVYPVSVFFGTKKPSDANEFLTSFVEEATTVCENSFKNCKISIEAVVCDAPAKSFVLYLKGHAGYDSCSKCLITGECYRQPGTEKGKKKRGRICFPGTGPFKLKNDEDYLLNKYIDSETGTQSILTKIPGFGCVSSIPLDYMHLILLGVMKKLISLWINGSKTKLPSDVMQAISDRLLLLRNIIPDEFNRKPRSLWEYKFWKATEFRTFLLYTGVVVLKNVKGFPKKLYSHFLLLHTSVSILVSETHLSGTGNIDAAQEMLELFVKDFDTLYGKEYISHNVHNLLHICNDAKLYGTVDKFSAFRFENYMSSVKRMLRKGDKPLQQIVRRYSEIENFLNNRINHSFNEFTLHQPHNKGPLTNNFITNIPEQYKVIKSKGFSINCNALKNSCVLLKDGTILISENVVKCGLRDIYLIGRRLSFKSSLYDFPDSKLLNIYVTLDDKKDERYCVPLTEVISKAWKIPTSEGEVIIPLLHKKQENKLY